MVQWRTNQSFIDAPKLDAQFQIYCPTPCFLVSLPCLILHSHLLPRCSSVFISHATWNICISRNVTFQFRYFRYCHSFAPTNLLLTYMYNLHLYVAQHVSTKPRRWIKLSTSAFRKYALSIHLNEHTYYAVKMAMNKSVTWDKDNNTALYFNPFIYLCFLLYFIQPGAFETKRFLSFHHLSNVDGKQWIGKHRSIRHTPRQSLTQGCSFSIWFACTIKATVQFGTSLCPQGL